MQKEKLMNLLSVPADKAGLFSRVGSDGVAIEEDYDTFFEGVREEALKQVGSSRNSEMLELELDDLNSSYRNRVLTHQTKERASYGAQVSASNADSAINDIGYFYNDDKQVGKSLRVVEASIRTQGQALGWDDNTVKNKMRQGRSMAYKTQIDSMIATDDPYIIEQAFNKYKTHEENENLTLSDRSAMDKYFDVAMPTVKARTEFAKLSTSAPSSPEEIAKFIIDGLEVDPNNRDKAHIDNDGGLVKYGINQNHNPGVDVANLDYDGAVGITTDKYYKISRR